MSFPRCEQGLVSWACDLCPVPQAWKHPGLSLMLCCCHLKILKYFLNKGFTFSFWAEPQDYVRILHTAVGEAQFCSLEVLHACCVGGWTQGNPITEPYTSWGTVRPAHVHPLIYVGGEWPRRPVWSCKENTAKAKPACFHHGNPERNCGWETGSHNASVQGILLGFIFCKRDKVLNSEIFLNPLENPT